MKLDNIKLSNPYLKLSSNFYNYQNISPLNDAFLIDANTKLLNELNIDYSCEEKQEFVNFLNGSKLLNGSKPFSMVYAGHQFGHYVPQLGDGRAINIGTIKDMHLQLKGAGVTKYSRSGDGRAVLRSSIREYLASEAMYALGIATTRAVALIGSKHKVYRESWEYGAIVLRASPSWIRFGTFEYFAHNDMLDDLKELADYAIEESYPHLANEEDKYTYFFLEVVGKTAKLIAKWMSVGFNHGVMNTDNMSIAGLTIDYGPYAFFDDFDYNYICNHTDTQGRYSFRNQPIIGKWNLNALLLALAKITDSKKLESALKYYDELYIKEYQRLMNKKLGLDSLHKEDTKLVQYLLGVLQSLQVDYTLFFRTLSHYKGDKTDILKLCLYHTPMREWLEDYDKRLEQNSVSTEERSTKMLKTNPKYTLKNYILQEAIESAEAGNYSTLKNLFTVTQSPYDEHSEFERWAESTPSEYKNLKLSCSS